MHFACFHFDFLHFIEKFYLLKRYNRVTTQTDQILGKEFYYIPITLKINDLKCSPNELPENVNLHGVFKISFQNRKNYIKLPRKRNYDSKSITAHTSDKKKKKKYIFSLFSCSTFSFSL